MPQDTVLCDSFIRQPQVIPSLGALLTFGFGQRFSKRLAGASTTPMIFCDDKLSLNKLPIKIFGSFKHFKGL